ncbi:TRAM domain-containing protein, partial [Erwinia amylovora]|uniref:TRAM domain-containing protein n=1 Tax=Erwinia amylovora TaxID=552 RepID=UPI0020BFB7B6
MTVTVHDLDSFGQGVAHHNGKALFVQGALPGEVAEVSISEDKRHFSRGVAKRIVTASPERVQPRCPHYSRCGGCQQQHASPALQQQSKAKALGHWLS